MSDDEKDNSVLPEEAKPPPAEDQSILDFPEQEETSQETEAMGRHAEQGLEALYEVPVQVSAVLGKTTMQVNQLLKLGRGAVVQLDRAVGDAIDIYVNDRLVARGEVVVVGEHLGVTLTEIVKTEQAA